MDTEIQQHRPKRLTLTGHSLGGAVGALLAYFFTTRYPDMIVELISFGAPNVGDKSFTKEFNKKVNNRHLTFTVRACVEGNGCDRPKEPYHLVFRHLA